MGTKHAPKRLTARIARVLDFILARGDTGATTWEIQGHCHVCGSDALRELRAMGYGISCRFEERLPSGSRVYRYRLEGTP